MSQERSKPGLSPVPLDPLVGPLKVRTFITNEDALTLQTCCEVMRIPMTIGGDPGGITGSITGFERQLDEDRNTRTDWMVVYLHPSREGDLYALRSIFLDAAGMAPNAELTGRGDDATTK